MLILKNLQNNNETQENKIMDKEQDGNQQKLEKIWERIDTNFNKLVSLIGEIVGELKNKGGQISRFFKGYEE